MRSDLIDVDLYKIYERPTAILFKETDDEEAEEIWLPKSLIEVEPTSNKRIFTVTLPEYLAHEKGLI